MDKWRKFIIVGVCLVLVTGLYLIFPQQNKMSENGLALSSSIRWFWSRWTMNRVNPSAVPTPLPNRVSSKAIPTSNKSSLPSPNAPYITVNPIDLEQIEEISKFRSCAGHDFSGHNFLQQIELDRAMKHYLAPLPAFYNDKAAMFAPFDGTVYDDGTRAEFVPGKDRGTGVSLLSPIEPNAVFEFMHIYPITPFKHGDSVKAGQLLGYAATKGGHDFDLVIRATKQPRETSRYGRYGDTFDSMFNHMTPEVLAEYEKFGLTKEMMFFSKEFRDARPCLFGAGVPNTPDTWVLLKRQ